MHDSSVFIGIDIGGTKIALAAFTHTGDQITTSRAALGLRKGSDVGALIVTELTSMIRKIHTLGKTLAGVGACIPGIVNPKTETVWAPNIQGWESFPLKELLVKAVPSAVPVMIESDRSCHLLGEVWKGQAKGKSDVIFLAVGTGIAIGILSNGRIVQGTKGVAGAIGWWGISEHYKEDYRDYGDLEYHASGDGLMRYAKDILEKNPTLKGYFTKETIEQATAKDLFEAYDHGDDLAKAVFEKAIKYWGISLANIISILNPEMIVLGGGVFGPAGRFKHQIIEEAKLWAQPISMQQVEICISSLKGDAGVLGAAYAAIKALES